MILISGQNLQVHIIIVMTKNVKTSFVSKNDLICHQVFVWYIQLFLQKLLSFWQLYNTSLNAAEQCQFIFCHNPNKYNTWKVHNLVLVLQISRCFLGQQNLQDLGLVLNLLKKRLILFASVWQVLPSRPAVRRRDRHSAAQLVDRRSRPRAASKETLTAKS